MNNLRDSLYDVQTIIWKEWKEHILFRGSFRSFGMLGTLLLLLSFGIFLPLQFGQDWITSPDLLLYWAWLPLFLVINIISDSIAGERERNTLETLLTTCLSESAILLGKIGAAILYAYGTLLLILLTGILTVNSFLVKEGILFYAFHTFCLILIFSFLISLLVASLGVLVSLKAKTVRQAQQGLSFAVMFFLFVPLFGYQYLPATIKGGISQLFYGCGRLQLTIMGLSLLLIFNTGALILAKSAFQRTKIPLK